MQYKTTHRYKQFADITRGITCDPYKEIFTYNIYSFIMLFDYNARPQIKHMQGVIVCLV